tara:strand:+ start:112 stop:501 length:390 start_codon:yes stop_codon:yes gene_type:complete
MKIKSIFKRLILIEIALIILGVISLFFQSQEVINFNEDYNKSFDEGFDMLSIFLFLIVYPVTIYLLYNFKSLGKQLYLIITIFGLAFAMFSGPIASDPWFYIIDILGCANTGAILVLLYFSPISKEFEK